MINPGTRLPARLFLKAFSLQCHQKKKICGQIDILNIVIGQASLLVSRAAAVADTYSGPRRCRTATGRERGNE